jgi:hypothetical protein
MGRRGRKASVRYYASKGGYFTHFEGKNIRLPTGPDDAPSGPTYLAALTKFSELMQVSTADTADQANTVRIVVDLYGQHLERNGQSRSLEILLDTYITGDNHGTMDEFKALCLSWLPNVTPLGMRVTVVRCLAKELHDRFLLTDLGGLSFGQGLDEAGEKEEI